MNKASASHTSRLLFTCVILCNVTCVPGRASVSDDTRRAEVEAGGAAGVRLQQKNPRRKADDRQRSRAPARKKSDWHFNVGEGVSRQEIILGSPCAAPHRFRVTSSLEKFFRFEQPTDAIQMRAGTPLRLAVIIDTSALDLGALASREVEVSLTVECLDCKKERLCIQTRRTIVAKVTVSKTAAQASDAEIEKLSKEGPQFPDTFALNDIEFRAFLDDGWWLDFVYKLARPGIVTLTITVDGFPPMAQEFRMGAGWHEEFIQLYNPTGRLNAATYSIKAAPDGPPAPDEDAFTLLSLAAGAPSGSSSSGGRPAFRPAHAAPIRGARIADAAYEFDASPLHAGVPLGLADLSFMPREIRVHGGRPSSEATYSFRTTAPFDGGARADVRLTEGGTSTRVSSGIFDRRLEAGETLTGTWACTREKDGAPSLGRHVLFLKAWYTVQAGGKWSVLNSSPVRVRS